MTLRYQVDMFFLYKSHSFYMFSLEIDLRKDPNLRLLQLKLRLDDKEIGQRQGTVVRWFNSICESVISGSLVVEVVEFTKQVEICNKIQDTIIALNARIETLSVYLFNTDELETKVMEMDDMRKLFPKLYEKGIVIEKRLDREESVSYYFLALKLPY